MQAVAANSERYTIPKKSEQVSFIFAINLRLFSMNCILLKERTYRQSSTKSSTKGENENNDTDDIPP
jgi:hypothetical protein